MGKKKKIKNIFIKTAKFLFNPHFLLCFGLAWIITNGWSYILLGVGTYYKIGWMVAVSSAYLAFLWLPISPEKIVTVAISMALLQWIFPKDEKTLGLLKELYTKAKSKIKDKKKHSEKNDTETDEESGKNNS